MLMSFLKKRTCISKLLEQLHKKAQWWIAHSECLSMLYEPKIFLIKVFSRFLPCVSSGHALLKKLKSPQSKQTNYKYSSTHERECTGKQKNNTLHYVLSSVFIQLSASFASLHKQNFSLVSFKDQHSQRSNSFSFFFLKKEISAGFNMPLIKIVALECPHSGHF